MRSNPCINPKVGTWKRSFETWEQANAHLVALRSKRIIGKDKGHVYRCPACKAYHVSSSEGMYTVPEKEIEVEHWKRKINGNKRNRRAGI